MREGIGQKAIHKLSDFLSNESGRVGAKSALAMGGLVGAAALTQMMFAPEAEAHKVEGCKGWKSCATFANTTGETCCCSYVKKGHGGTNHFHCKTPRACKFNYGGSCVSQI